MDLAALTILPATTPLARLRGLAHAPAPPAGHALRIDRCRSVHTFGMRFPLDLVWLGAGDVVVRVDSAVPPRRVRTCRRARAVVEVPVPSGVPS